MEAGLTDRRINLEQLVERLQLLRGQTFDKRPLRAAASPIRSMISAAGNSAPRSRSVATMAFTIEAPLSDIAAASIADNSAARRS
jgi:hypothetical protein